MSRRPIRTFALLALLGSLAACGGSRAPNAGQVLLPPEVDLAPHARIGLITFTTTGAKGGLATLATQRFAEHVLGDQRGIELLELGPVSG